MEDATDRQMNREGNDASQLFFRILIGHVVVRPPGKGQFLRTRRSRFSEDSIVSLSLSPSSNQYFRQTKDRSSSFGPPGKTPSSVAARQVSRAYTRRTPDGFLAGPDETRPC